MENSAHFSYNKAMKTILLLLYACPLLAQAPLVQFVEELRLGGDESRPETLWSHAMTCFSVDAQGRIFVGDIAENRILAFDASGQFIKEVARAGEGPGEMRSLGGLRALRDGRLLAIDFAGKRATLNYFDQKLRHQPQAPRIDTDYYFQNLTIAPDGRWLGAEYGRVQEGDPTILLMSGLFDGQFKEHQQLSKSVRPFPDMRKASSPEYWSQFVGKTLALTLGDIGLVAIDNSGRIYTGTSSTYAIQRWLPNADKKLSTIEHQDPQRYPNAEAHLQALAEKLGEAYLDQGLINKVHLQKAIDIADFPPLQLPMLALIPTEDGHLWVVRHIDLDSRINTADLFDPSGRFLGTQTFTNLAMLRFGTESYVPSMQFHQNKAYALETNEDGELQLVRYTTHQKP